MSWEQSIYSALCFLDISCPCALVISVPLSFFAGIGRASSEGVLVKGGNYLETLEKLLELAALAESRSTHPIAQSILAAYGREVD